MRVQPEQTGSKEEVWVVSLWTKHNTDAAQDPLKLFTEVVQDFDTGRARARFLCSWFTGVTAVAYWVEVESPDGKTWKFFD